MSLILSRARVALPPASGSDAEADWIRRSTTHGTIHLAQDFRTDGAVTSGLTWNVSNQAALIARTDLWGRLSSIDIPGVGSGAFRIKTPTASSDTNSHGWASYLDPSFSQNVGFGGTEFWLYSRIRFDHTRLVLPSGPQLGWKLIIVGAAKDFGQLAAGSSNFSHVTQDTQYLGFNQPYTHTAISNNPMELTQTFPEGDLINKLPGFNRGSGATSYDQYCIYNNPPSGARYRGCPYWTQYGLGVPSPTWLNILQRFKVPDYTFDMSYGTNNEWDVWYAAQDSATWTPYLVARGYPTGHDDDFAQGMNSAEWLNYETSGRGPGQVDTYMDVTQIICKTGVTDINTFLPAAGC